MLAISRLLRAFLALSGMSADTHTLLGVGFDEFKLKSKGHPVNVSLTNKFVRPVIVGHHIFIVPQVGKLVHLYILLMSMTNSNFRPLQCQP